MSKFKLLSEVYEESKGNKLLEAARKAPRKYKDTTIINREIDKISKDITSAQNAAAQHTGEIHKYVQDQLGDGRPTNSDVYWDTYSAGEQKVKKKVDDNTANLNELQKKLQDAKSRLSTARNLESPVAPSYEVENKSNSYGTINPMHHNYSIYKNFSDTGKGLYEELRTTGNIGGVVQTDKEFYRKYHNIKATELSAIMKLAIDLGYKLDEYLYNYLHDLSPKLAANVSNYEGGLMEPEDYLNSKHKFYNSVYNRYMNKYEDEKKALKFTTMFRKEKRKEFINKKDEESASIEEALTLKSAYDSMYTPRRLSGLEYVELYECALNLTEDLAGDATRVQGKLLYMLSNGNDMIVRKLIDDYGALWRSCIDLFMDKYNSVPKVADLIDYTNKTQNIDVQEIAKVLRKRMGKGDGRINAKNLRNFKRG